MRWAPLPQGARTGADSARARGAGAVRWAPALLLLCGCSLAVGPGRVLPGPLAFDPAAVEGVAAASPLGAPAWVTLGNGLELVVVEDHGTPLVDVGVAVRCGWDDQPREREGLAELTLVLVGRGGAEGLEPDEQRRLFARLGLRWVATIDDRTSAATLSGRAADTEVLVATLSSMLRAPRFDDGALRQVARSYAEALSRSRGPSSLAALVRRRALYGVRPASAETVQTIVRADLVELHRRCFQPAKVVLTISGDVEPARARALFERHFGDWQNGPAQPAPAAVRPRSVRRVWLVRQPQDAQVQITFFGPGHTPDPALEAAGDLLMPVLRGHLHSELREQFGLSYSVEGFIEESAGGGAAQLRYSAAPGEALDALRHGVEILDGWWSRWPLTPALLDENREVLAQFVGVEDPALRAASIAWRRLVGGAREEYQRRPAAVRAATFEDVRRLFVTCFKPQQLQILVTGPLDPAAGWRDFGPVTVVRSARDVR